MPVTYDVDLTEAESLDEVGKAGNYLAAEGMFHVEIEDVSPEDDGKKSPAVRFDLRVLAGTDPSQVGKTHKERLYMTEKNKPRIGLFAKRLGLIGPADCGKRVSVDWEAAKGRQCIVKVKKDSYTKDDGSSGTSYKVDYAGLYDLNDPEVKNVPKASGAIAAAVPSGRAAANSNGNGVFDDL